MWAQQGSRNSKYGCEAEMAWVSGLVFAMLMCGSGGEREGGGEAKIASLGC